MERIRLWAQWRTARRAKSSPGGRLDCDAIRPSRLQTRTPSPESRRACHESGRQGPDPRFYQFLAWFGRVYFSVLLLDMSLQPVPSEGTNPKGRVKDESHWWDPPVSAWRRPSLRKHWVFAMFYPPPSSPTLMRFPRLAPALLNVGQAMPHLAHSDGRWREIRATDVQFGLMLK